MEKYFAKYDKEAGGLWVVTLNIHSKSIGGGFYLGRTLIKCLYALTHCGCPVICICRYRLPSELKRDLGRPCHKMIYLGLSVFTAKCRHSFKHLLLINLLSVNRVNIKNASHVHLSDDDDHTHTPFAEWSRLSIVFATPILRIHVKIGKCLKIGRTR